MNMTSVCEKKNRVSSFYEKKIDTAEHLSKTFFKPIKVYSFF